MRLLRRRPGAYWLQAGIAATTGLGLGLLLTTPMAQAQQTRGRSQFGNNVNGLRSYFTDIIKGGDGHWSTYADPEDDNGAEDADGWPTGDAGFFVNRGSLGSVPTGTYLMTFQGKAQVKTYLFSAQWVVAGDPNSPYQNTLPKGAGYNAATNTTTAKIVVPSNQNLCCLQFGSTQRDSSASPAGGITGLHLYQPTTNGGSTPYDPSVTFLPSAKAQFAPYDAYRFMAGTNWSILQHWSDRTLPGHPADTRLLPPATWYGQQYTVGPEAQNGAIEYEVQWCNEENHDLYICIPAMADDDYISKIAQAIAFGTDGHTPYASAQSNPKYAPLKPGLHVYIEYSNEIWNPIFGQFHEVVAAAQATGVPGSNINYDNCWDGKNYSQELVENYIAARYVTISNLFRKVFGDAAMPGTYTDPSGPRVRPIMEWQYNNSNGTAEYKLEFLTNWFNNAEGSHVLTPHPPSYYLWGAGGATYYNSNLPDGTGPGQTDNPSTTVAQIIAAGIPETGKDNPQANNWHLRIQGQVAWSKYYGLHNSGYEGGLAVGGDGMKNAALALRSDPSSKETEKKLMAEFAADGGDLWIFGTYSQLEYDPKSPLQAGVVDIVNGTTPLPAVTFGTPVPGDVNDGADYFRGEDANGGLHKGAKVNSLVLASSGGPAQLSLNYATGRTDGGLVRILVNGVLVTPSGGIALPTTGNWGKGVAVYSAPIPITLKPGQNGIHLYAVHGDMNLYGLRVTAGTK